MTSTGYNWGNTSQWSKLPSTQTNNQNNSNQPQQNTASMPNPTNYNSNNYQPSGTPPETRRDIIVRLYKRILGREADAAGLNYYLSNYQISEHEIAKDMYESTEFQDILAKAKDVRGMLAKLEESNKKIKELEIKLQNEESLAKNYKILLEQQSQQLSALQNGQPAQMQSDVQEYQNFNEGRQFVDNNMGDDYLLEDPFAEDYTKKRRGCFGMIKSLFRFD